MSQSFFSRCNQLNPRLVGRQLNQVFSTSFHLPVRRRKSGFKISNASINQSTQRILKLIKSLQSSSLRISSLTDFGPDHSNHCFKYIHQLSLSPGSFDNWITTLNRFLKAIGKYELTESGSSLRQSVGLPSRNRYCVENKSTADLKALHFRIEEINRENSNVGAVLRLLEALPLRVREAASLDVKTASQEARIDQVISLTKGTKNGRPRKVQIWDERQILVLENLVPLTNELHGSLIPADQTLKNFLSRFYRITRKHSLTRESRMNPHSLRHLGLQRLFTHLTGLPPPIFGIGPDLKQSDSRAREGFQSVSEAAGHCDRNKASAYLGSIRAYRSKLPVGAKK